MRILSIVACVAQGCMVVGQGGESCKKLDSVQDQVECLAQGVTGLHQKTEELERDQTRIWEQVRRIQDMQASVEALAADLIPSPPPEKD